MRLQIVESAANEAAFKKLPHLIYKSDPNWVCHLEQDIDDVFNRKSNPYFKSGDACRWLLYDERNRLIGRVAAFYNEKYFKQSNILKLYR